MSFDPEKIEARIDRAVTADITLDGEQAGIAIKRLIDAMEVAKVMALSKQAIPAFMRNEPGLCYAAVVRAVRWMVDPYFVAEQMYIVQNRGEEKIAFQAQLVVAIINAHAPVQGRIRIKYEGEGDTRVGIAYAIPKGETEPVEYRTPTLGSLKAARGKNDRGQLKGSPLYETDPDQQLFYYAARGLCRRYFPEVLAGVYDPDELEQARDVTPVAPAKPALADRLKNRAAGGRGFDPHHIERTAREATGATTLEAEPVVAHIGATAPEAAETAAGATSTDPSERPSISENATADGGSQAEPAAKARPNARTRGKNRRTGRG